MSTLIGFHFKAVLEGLKVSYNTTLYLKEFGLNVTRTLSYRNQCLAQERVNI